MLCVVAWWRFGLFFLRVGFLGFSGFVFLRGCLYLFLYSVVLLRLGWTSYWFGMFWCGGGVLLES